MHCSITKCSQVLRRTYYSHYLHLFGLDYGTTVIWPASFDLKILSTHHQTMTYAVKTHNKLDSVPEASIFSHTLYNALLMSTSSPPPPPPPPKFPKAANLFEILTLYC